jgi:ABC-type dipeptide/oligopeptide/nickel transport system ATPase component
MMDKQVLIHLKDFSVSYSTRLGWVSAVNNISLDIYKGEILGLVGESGCGKSSMGKALMRMIPPPAKITASEYTFDGMDVMAFDENQLRDFRGKRISIL